MSWPLVKLRDCCEVVGGATPKREVPEYWDSPDVPWVTPKDVSDLASPTLEDAPEYISVVGFKSCSTSMLPKGSVLVTSRAPIGNIAIAGRDLCTNQGFKSLIPGKSVDGLYLYYCMKHSSQRLQALGNGATFKEVSKKIVEEFEIPLPPLPEQKRIAAILDKADAIRRKRHQAIQLADDFLRAVFLHMFGDPVTNTKGWDVKRIEEVAAKDKYAIKAGPFGSALKKEDYVPEGYKIYGQEQVIRDDLEYGDYFINEEKYESLASCSVSEGDVLISLVGSFGKVSVVPKDYHPGIINPRLMKIRFNESCASPWYMKYLLTTKEMIRKIEGMSHGGTMGILNVGKIRDLEVINPPLNLQESFLKISTQVRSIKGRCELVAANPLFDSLSQKAFSGQL